jgi:hypothetical protein
VRKDDAALVVVRNASCQIQRHSSCVMYGSEFKVAVLRKVALIKEDHLIWGGIAQARLSHGR